MRWRRGFTAGSCQEKGKPSALIGALASRRGPALRPEDVSGRRVDEEDERRRLTREFIGRDHARTSAIGHVTDGGTRHRERAIEVP